jgi:DMSO/TMAO reductase YedYZ molybdopterin-dependent catalytic subunit
MPPVLLATPRNSIFRRDALTIGAAGLATPHVFLQRVGADLRARYVSFKCFDGYSSIDMPSALHPQTILALDFLDKPLAPEWGAPLRLRIPTKLGFKSAKNIQAISVTNTYPGGYWKDQGSRGHNGCLFCGSAS